jgi:glycosyltransferase involved in cell wall biosynthesis
VTVQRRILLSAYACEPSSGSEPGVGWNQARQAARFNEVWVLTRKNNAEPIRKELSRNPLPNAHWCYYDLPRWLYFWKKGQRGVHLYYYLWQIGAYFVAKRLHTKIGFDLVHHVTLANYWMPSLLALLPVPFIWGPVGGAESMSRPFLRGFGERGKTYEMLRLLGRWRGEHDLLVRVTAKRACIALATTRETAQRLARLRCRDVRLLGAIGISEEEIAELSDHPLRAGPVRFVSVGRLLDWKGYHLSLPAFAKARASLPASSYWVIGDGPARMRLVQLARRLNVAESVQFWGALPRGLVLKKLAECDILVHPSLHESGGCVCLEAMAAGRPVVCLDYGGPAILVADETGIKVPAESPGQVIESLAQAMLRIAENPRLRRELSIAARRRVQSVFAWDKRGEVLERLYREAIGRAGA